MLFGMFIPYQATPDPALGFIRASGSTDDLGLWWSTRLRFHHHAHLPQLTHGHSELADEASALEGAGFFAIYR